MESNRPLSNAQFSTKAIHEGYYPGKSGYYSVVPPIVTSSIFADNQYEGDKDYFYSRKANPTRETLEKALAGIGGGKYALTFSAGVGATTCIMNLLEQGDHLISCEDIYGGTRSLFSVVLKKSGVNTTYIDLDDPAKLDSIITSKTKMVWLESPSNPLMKVIDIRGVADRLKKHPQVILVVDNTFLTPYYQRPLELGADISMHSLTKYLNGHDDVVMGGAIMNRKDIYDKLKFLQTGMGIIPSPFDCSMVLRGLKTLPLRMKQHMLSATEIIKCLDKHPMVEKVLHPSLPTHPQHELSKRQTMGYSGILSFYIRGDRHQTNVFLKSLKLFTVAGSLGGPDSLASIPAMTHVEIPREQRLELGLSDTLIRLSVGLEDPKDLIADITQALDRASTSMYPSKI